MSGQADLFRALAVMCEPPTAEHARLALALGLPGPPVPTDYAETFLLQVYPYASVHLGAEGMLGGEAGDRVAGFWRALGLNPPAEPDHLAALLGLYATLIEREEAERDEARAALLRSSRHALLWEHIVSWCPLFLDKVRDVAPPAYRAWADLLIDALHAEVRQLGPLGSLPLALRAAEPLPAAAGAAEWLKALLAPVRTGFIITRADLGLCARRLDVGLRMGERAFILRALLEQDSDGTLAWLVDEAGSAALTHARHEAMLGDVARFWRRRAETTAGVLIDLRAAA